MTRPPWIHLSIGSLPSDKIAHFLLSALLGLSLYLALRSGKAVSRFRSAVLAVLSGMLVSLVSEVLQTMTPGRDALSRMDMISDFMGYALAVTTVSTLAAAKTRLRKAPPNSPL